MKHSFILGLFLLLFFNLCNAQEYPMFMTEEGHIIIEVTLNDSVKANFILDTGAGAIVLSAKTFERIKGSAKKAGFFTGFRHDGDRLDGIIYQIPSLAIGDVKQENILTGIYPPLDDYGIDGLVSLKFFEDRPFSIDFKNRKIRFLENTALNEVLKNGTSLPIDFEISRNVSIDIFLPICLNDKVQVNAQFDTGNGYGGFVINPYFIEELGLDTTQAKTYPYVTPISGKEITDTVFPLKSVSVCTPNNSLTKTDASATFREGLICEALIGSTLFKDKEITIDIPGKRLIIHN